MAASEATAGVGALLRKGAPVVAHELGGWVAAKERKANGVSGWQGPTHFHEQR